MLPTDCSLHSLKLAACQYYLHSSGEQLKALLARLLMTSILDSDEMKGPVLVLQGLLSVSLLSK